MVTMRMKMNRNPATLVLSKDSSRRFLMNGILFLFSIIATATNFGCTAETETVIIPPSAQSLVDPAIIPQVLYTYPANNSVGPFDVYVPPFYGCGFECSPCDCEQPAHFYVQFNKMMDLSSFISGAVHCADAGNIEVVRVLTTYGGHDPLSSVVRFTVGDSMAERIPYRVGKVYRITLGTSIADVNQNHPASAYTFSFTPEPRMRILKSIPAPGDTIIVSGLPSLMLNTIVDTGIYRSLHFVPPAAGSWHIGSDSGSGLYFQPNTRFTPGTDYNLVLDAGARDHSGNTLDHEIQVPFHTYGFRVLRPVQGSNTQLDRLNAEVDIYISDAVKRSTVASAVRLQPSDGLIVDGYNTRILAYSGAADFLPSTTYVLTISTELQTEDGTHLSQPFSCSFTTPPFQVNFSLRNNDRYVDRGSRLSVYCNGRIDTTTIRSAFSLSPPVQGHIDIDRFEATGFSFYPDSLYLPLTRYRAIISNSLHSLGGFSIPKADTIYFTTNP